LHPFLIKGAGKGDFMDFKKLGENLMLEEDEYKELVALFIDTGSADVEQLTSAIIAGDEKNIKRYSHSLAGAAGNLGIAEIHTLGKDIEVNAAQYSKDLLMERVKKIEVIIVDVKSKL
jgi:histidine phosphotransfer protein HptB